MPRSLRAALIAGLLCLISIAARGQKPELVTQLGHSFFIESVAFSADGRLVLTGGDHTALWETTTGKELRRFEGGSVSSVAFSPDGRLVLTGAGDHTALWETTTGKELRRFEGGLGSSVAAFSPDGLFVVTSNDNTAQLWETERGKKVRRFEGHAGSVSSVAFSPDGQFILTGSTDSTALLWDVTTGKEFRRFEGHSSDVNSVAFSPDGRLVVTGSADKTALLWDVATGQKVRRFEGHSTSVNSVTFSPDGRFILTGSRDINAKNEDRAARLWEAATGKEMRRFEGHAGSISAVAFSPDGEFILTGSTDKTARLWETATGHELRRFAGRSAGVTSVAFSQDHRFVLTGSLDKTVRLWDMVRGRELHRFTGHAGPVTSAAFSLDSRLVVTGSWDKTSRLWDTTTGQELRRFAGHSKMVTSVAFSPNSQFVITGSTDKTARLWDVATGKELRRFEKHSDWVTSVALSPDGRLALTGSQDNTARLWETATGKELRRFDGDASVTSVGFSPDGRLVVTGRSDNTARLWQVATGEEMRQFNVHLGPVNSVAVSPDGRFVLTGDNRSARLWEATGKEVRRFEGHSAGIASVAFSSDGRFILTGGEDATSRLWDIASGRELCRLVSFNDGTWAVVDPNGHFDTENLEEMDGLHWMMADDPLRALAPETFMRDYYEPGLLPRILKDENFKPVRPLSDLNRVQPKVAITSVEPTTDDPTVVSVRVEVAGDQRTFTRGERNVLVKSGVSDVRVFREGQLVGYRDGEVKLVDNKATLTFPGIRLAGVEGKTNIEFSAYAFNEDRVKSPTARRSYAMPTGLKSLKGRAYVISVGVNDSEDPAYRLSYAVNDAQEIQKTVCKALQRSDVFSEVVPVTLVQKPRKQDVQTVLDLLAGRPVSNGAKKEVSNADKIMPARPEDTVLISFSCHGDSDRLGNFYLVPYDIGAADTHSKIEDIYPKCISSQELSKWLRDVDAGEMVMIVDACHSAAAVESADFKPGPMGSRGLGQLAYDKGMRILAASQADSVALESGNLGHGLLSYALLKEGLEAGQADFKPKDGTIWLSEWLGYAVDRLPKLYAEKLGPRGVLLTAVGQGPPPLAQQPALFDFTRQKRDIILVGKSDVRMK